MKQDQKKEQVWLHSIMACGGSESLRPAEKTTQTQREHKKRRLSVLSKSKYKKRLCNLKKGLSKETNI